MIEASSRQRPDQWLTAAQAANAIGTVQCDFTPSRLFPMIVLWAANDVLHARSMAVTDCETGAALDLEHLPKAFWGAILQHSLVDTQDWVSGTFRSTLDIAGSWVLAEAIAVQFSWSDIRKLLNIDHEQDESLPGATIYEIDKGSDVGNPDKHANLSELALQNWWRKLDERVDISVLSIPELWGAVNYSHPQKYVARNRIEELSSPSRKTGRKQRPRKMSGE